MTSSAHLFWNPIATRARILIGSTLHKSLRPTLRTGALTSIICVAMLGTAVAQTDRVYTADGKSVTGTVTTTAKDGVQLKRNSNLQPITAADIIKVLWEGDPGELTRAREFAIGGQHEKAIAELKKVNVSKLSRDGQQADFAFYQASSLAQLALAGNGSRAAAVAKVREFLGKNSDSFHFYTATQLLGDLALSLGKADEAIKYYGYLGRSRSVETKIRALYLIGTAKAASGDASAAIADFDRVVGAPASSSSALEIQTLAKAGKAAALAAAGDSEAGLAIIDDLINNLTPSDVTTAAAIYNAAGANHEASGNVEPAIEAYLHTHLMYAADPQRHATALSRLIPLWDQVNRPERANEMRNRLKELYPGFGQ